MATGIVLGTGTNKGGNFLEKGASDNIARVALNGNLIRPDSIDIPHQSFTIFDKSASGGQSITFFNGTTINLGAVDNIDKLQINDRLIIDTNSQKAILSPIFSLDSNWSSLFSYPFNDSDLFVNLAMNYNESFVRVASIKFNKINSTAELKIAPNSNYVYDFIGMYLFNIASSSLTNNFGTSLILNRLHFIKSGLSQEFIQRQTWNKAKPAVTGSHIQLLGIDILTGEFSAYEIYNPPPTPP